MNIFSVFLFVIFVVICSISASSFDKTSELRDELGSLLKGIRAFPEVVEEDREKIEKYAEKLIKSFEKKALSSKGPSSSADLSESYGKHSAKILECVEFLSCPPEIQVSVFELVQKFLESVRETVKIEDDASRETDHFIEKLSTMPEGSLASHYHNLWQTLDTIETADLGPENIPPMIDSAFIEFTHQFVQSFRRDFDMDSMDPITNGSLFAGMLADYNEVVEKIARLIPQTGDISV